MIAKEKIHSLAEPFIEGNGMFIVQLEINSSNKITLVIDSMKGVDIDDCVNLSRVIESGLDRDAEDFELEVSSAGIGVPFKVIQQYHKNISKDIEVVLKSGIKIKGTLLSVDDQGFNISFEKKVKTEDKKKKQLLVENKYLLFEEASKVYNLLKF
jgi:ribosome maturation factor RimP